MTKDELIVLLQSAEKKIEDIRNWKSSIHQHTCLKCKVVFICDEQDTCWDGRVAITYARCDTCIFK